MDRLQMLKAFVAVAEAASFTRAAQSLAMPRATVTVAIQQLEARLGARLLHRTTRHVTLTQEGAAYLERCRRLLADFEESDALFRPTGAPPRGKLRVDLPGRIARLVIAPRLPAFFARYPEIELELGATDRAVDLVREGVDCVIRVGELADSSLIARRVGLLKLINCASPRYLAKHGAPRRIGDLARHHVVNYATPLGSAPDPWEVFEDGQRRTVKMRSMVTVDNAETYIACCLAGLGLIQIPAYDVREAIASRRLVEVLPRFAPPPLPISVLYPHRRPMSERVRVFVEWATATLRERVEALEQPLQRGKRTLRASKPQLF